MKKTLSMALALLLALCCIGFASAEEKQTVTVWTSGSQNVQDLFTALADAYNAQPDAKYTATIQFILSGTGDESLSSRIAAAYQTGQTNTDFDLLADNTSSFQTYVDEAGSEDLFIAYDPEKIPGLDNVTVTPVIMPDKLVPYRCTTVVFAYDSERIPADELPHTWDELTDWIAAHPGRFAYNEPDTGGAGSSFVLSAIYRFIEDESAKTSNDPKWVDESAAGFEWLVNLHPNLYATGGKVLYPNKNQGTLDLLINKEVDIIPAWADQILTNVANGTLPETTSMYQLDDAPLTGSDVSFGIPSIGSNPDGAQDFISFVISPEGQKICLENMKAIPVISSDLIESDEKDLVSQLGNYNFISIGTLWADYLYPIWMEEILPL
ncbi:MAG: extracellular solute-binding protein [Clostridia bacterium]|nr:extracellular solute-binding protein [Clostridia bacterium]